MFLACLLAAAAAEGSLPYGTNRITPANLYTLQQKIQWDGPREIQALRTEHFDIYMGKEEEAIASRIASIAEEWVPRLEERMGVRFDSLVEKGERIPLIGYTSETRFLATNTAPGFVGEGVQGFFDLVRGRIVLPFTGSNERLEHVIRHEMVHSFTLPLLEASWKRYQKDRDRVRERQREWGELVYVARRFTHQAPREAFPRFVRGRLAPVEDEVALPPPVFGSGTLHPQIVFGYAEGSSRDPRIRVSLRLANPAEAAFLASLRGAEIDSLAATLGTGSRSVLRVLSRPYPWTVEAEEEILFDEPVPSAGARRHLERFLGAVPRETTDRAESPPLRMLQADLLVLDSVDPAAFREAWEAIAPLYRALARTRYDGPVLPEHRSPSSARFDEAERALFRYVPPDLRPRLFSLGILEGVAEYYAAEWSDLNDLVLRDLVHEGRLVPFQHLGPQHGYLVYVEGLSFFRYLSERFGEETIGLLLESLYRGRRETDVFEAVYGEALDTLSMKWEISLRRSILSQFTDQTDIREHAAPLESGSFAGPPRADGGRVLFASFRRGRAEIRAWENGKYSGIAKDRLPGFESLHLGDPNLDIRGDRAVFVALSKGRDEVVAVRLPGNEVVARRRFDPLLTIESLALSPDGKEVVVAALHESGRGDLFRFALEGGPLERLTDDLAHETDLEWGEEGILFAADRETPGRYDLHWIDPEGNERRILRLPTSIGNPRWLDKDRILYLAREGNRPRNVFLFHRRDGTTALVTRDAVGISAFDHDGDTLYLRTNRRLRFQIWKTPLSPLLDSAGAPVAVAGAAAPVPWTPPEPAPHEKGPYKRKYGPDLFFLTGNAFYSQTLLGLSDILGDRKIALYLGSNADRSDDLLKYLSGGATVHFLEGRVDYRLGAFHFADEYLTDQRGFFFRRETGVLGGITVPFDRFRSIGLNVLIKNVREETLGSDAKNDFGEVTVQGILGYDTAVPDRFGYGFGSGVLSSLLFSTDFRLSPESSIGSNTVLGDLRVYVPFGWDVVWANRLSGGFSSGEFPQQILIGGSLTLRGYDFLSLRGERYLLANEEVRFPLPVRLLVGDLAVVSRLQGALFVDAGDAWFEGHSPVFRGSTGFGLRNGIGGAVLRWDLAKKFERRRFLEGWETDFFIGWNF